MSVSNQFLRISAALARAKKANDVRAIKVLAREQQRVAQLCEHTYNYQR